MADANRVHWNYTRQSVNKAKDKSREETVIPFLRQLAAAVLLISLLLATTMMRATAAEKAYGPGVAETEVKIGNIMPYSGPASAYGVLGKTEAAYFKKMNAEGGINGRKINFISYDDSYSPPKTVEQARKLVEDDEVLLIFQSLGTPPNTAIQKYMNAKKVPQLFVATGATKWNDPKHFPWTMGLRPNYQSEAHIYASYLLKNNPNGKIGVLFQNDDYGKDYLKGLKDALNGRMHIVAELPYETTDPTIDSQIISLRASGADVLFDVTTPKFAAQAIKKAAEIGWRPLHLLNNVSANVGAVLRPAGLENSKDILSTMYSKDPTDPTWKDDPEYKEWLAFMDKYYPEGDRTNKDVIEAYIAAQVLVHVLKQCGDNLTRENVMRQAEDLHGLVVAMLLPGITIDTSPTDFAPIKRMQMMRFTGERWELFGPIMNGALGGI
jgi:branched-chain amino acid transport system substrate-binding protein